MNFATPQREQEEEFDSSGTFVTDRASLRIEKSHALYDEAEGCFSKRQYDQAIKKLLEIIIIKTEDWKFMIKVYNLMSNCYCEIKHYPDAIEFLKNELYLHKVLMNSDGVASCYIKLATLYQAIDEMKTAKRCCGKVIEAAAEEKTGHNFTARRKLAEICFEESRKKTGSEAEDLLAEARTHIRFCVENGKESDCHVLFLLAKIEKADGNMLNTVESFRKCLTACRSEGDGRSHEQLAQRVYSETYSIFEKLDVSSATACACLASQSAERIGDRLSECIYAINLAELHEKRGIPEEAVFYALKGLSLAIKLKNVKLATSASNHLAKSLYCVKKLPAAIYFTLLYSVFAFLDNNMDGLSRSRILMEKFYKANSDVWSKGITAENPYAELATVSFAVRPEDFQTIDAWVSTRKEAAKNLKNDDKENAPKEESLDFIELLLKVQGGRMDEQRSVLRPSVGRLSLASLSSFGATSLSSASGTEKKKRHLLPGLVANIPKLSKSVIDLHYLKKLVGKKSNLKTRAGSDTLFEDDSNDASSIKMSDTFSVASFESTLRLGERANQ